MLAAAVKRAALSRQQQRRYPCLRGSLVGQRLVTYQTDALGQPVNQILVEAATDIDKELYLGAVVDRATRRIVFMASTEGGVEIEKVAEETPELIHK